MLGPYRDRVWLWGRLKGPFGSVSVHFGSFKSGAARWFSSRKAEVRLSGHHANTRLVDRNTSCHTRPQHRQPGLQAFKAGTARTCSSKWARPGEQAIRVQDKVAVTDARRPHWALWLSRRR